MSAQAADGRHPALSRMLLDKQYHGPLQPSSAGRTLAVHGGVSGSAACVAIKAVTATLDGRAGSFALVRHGQMSRGRPSLEIRVVPDSGTRALAGPGGRLAIRIEGHMHFYDFDSQLPEA